MGRLVVGTGARLALTALVFAGVAPACHLAETPDPIHCPAGQHADTGRCVQDNEASTVIVIRLDDAGACLVAPKIVSVASTSDFQFRNDDNVDHMIRGIDGQTWATIPAHQSSPFIAIKKVGHWAYEVSGCAEGGSVSVD